MTNDEMNAIPLNCWMHFVIHAVNVVREMIVVPNCCAMYSHYYHMTVVANGSMDFVNRLKIVLAAIVHCSVNELGVLELWHVNTQSNYFC